MSMSDLNVWLKLVYIQTKHLYLGSLLMSDYLRVKITKSLKYPNFGNELNF